MKKRTPLLNTSFVLICGDFPVLYWGAVVARDPLVTTVALAVMGVAAILALAS